MAALTAEQLEKLRQTFVAKMTVVDFDKPEINGAFQAMEDWWETSGPLAYAAIEAAIPLKLDVNEKTLLVAAWANLKAGELL